MLNKFDYKLNRRSKDNSAKSQRQLRVGEELRHLISNALLRETFYDQIIENTTITVTEVNVSPDLKNAKVFVIPLGGKDADKVIDKLKEFSFVIRKVLSKKIVMKFLPKLFFVKDSSFDYAEKIENLIKQTNK